jgi:hypothetical protein
VELPSSHAVPAAAAFLECFSFNSASKSSSGGGAADSDVLGGIGEGNTESEKELQQKRMHFAGASPLI